MDRRCNQEMEGGIPSWHGSTSSYLSSRTTHTSPGCCNKYTIDWCSFLCSVLRSTTKEINEICLFLLIRASGFTHHAFTIVGSIESLCYKIG